MHAISVVQCSVCNAGYDVEVPDSRSFVGDRLWETGASGHRQWCWLWLLPWYIGAGHKNKTSSAGPGTGSETQGQSHCQHQSMWAHGCVAQRSWVFLAHPKPHLSIRKFHLTIICTMHIATHTLILFYLLML